MRRWTPGRYRWRTRLRGSLPYRLLWLSPKGRGDCGNHEWYRHDDDTWRCYHCEVGEARSATHPRQSEDEAVQAARAASPA